MTTHSYKRKAGLNATAYSHLIHALFTAPRSLAELQATTGMGNAAARCIKALRDRGILHVSGWRPDGHGRMTVREYSFGYGTDVPCPAMSRAEIVRRYKERRKLARRPA